ncbi:hypothetical protein I350_02213 [Cryptococcus amylolentus CBS 6273]|uniref:Zn(2)-C6 fungal-type domain-containing protein n=1 Tax=Cryptococcus amylolentus CBS 6273 TaxID=1296118 RepID=A0A1E3KA49_9TREE|nr:hypothetical protein I350_02213 [Cryptococcus amylolentus CBS 6273]
MSSDSLCFSGISPIVPYPFPFSLPTYRDTSTEDLVAGAVATPSYEEEAEDGLFIDGVEVSQDAFFDYHFGIQPAPEAGATVETAGSPTCDPSIATVSAPATSRITSTTTFQTPTKNFSTSSAPSTNELSAQTVVTPSHEEEADAELFINGVKVSREAFFNYQFGIQPAPEKAGTIDDTAGSLTREPSIVPISPPTTPKFASTAISKTPITPTQKSAGKKRSPNRSNKSPAKAPTPAHLKRAGIKRTKKHTRSSMACECCRIARRSCNVDDIYRCGRCTSRGLKCCFWLEGRGEGKMRPRAIELGLEIFLEDGKKMVIAPPMDNITGPAPRFESQPAAAPSFNYGSNGLAGMPEFQAQPDEAEIDWSFVSYVASDPATASNVHVSLPAPTTPSPPPATFGPTLGLEMDVAEKGHWDFLVDFPAVSLFTGPAMTNNFLGLEGMMDVGSSCEAGGQPFYWDEVEAMA